MTPDDPAHDENETRSKPASTGSQRRLGRSARLLAFRVLYEVDIARHSPSEVFNRQARDEQTPPEVEERARTLVQGVLTHRLEIDELIQNHATAWPLDQISAVERNILRLALYEMEFDEHRVPGAVAINEAVELAKMFGSDAASRFINGVLGSVSSELGAQSFNHATGPEQSESQGGTD